MATERELQSEMHESQTTATRRSAESLPPSNSSFEDFQTPVNGKAEADDPLEENILITDIYSGCDVIEEIDCLDHGEGIGRDDGSDAKVNKGNVKNWAYVNFSGMSDKEASRFLSKLIKMCVSIGMDFFPMPTRSVHVTPYLPTDIEKTLVVMDFNLTRYFIKSGADGNLIGLLIVFLPDCTHTHEEVEKVCKSLGFVFQCFSSQDAKALKEGFLRKAANEIREKVIQHHHKGVQRPLVFDDIPFVSEAPTVIFGADISSSAPEEGSISIASVVASINWPGANKYKALVSYQPYNELAIKDLFNPEKENGGMFSELLIDFHKNTEEWPQKIIFFRNGGTGCQLMDTYLCEVDYIKNACSSLWGKIPSVTFVVVAQRPCDESQGMREVVHGSVLGDDNCIPIKFEFSCGTSREGTPMRCCVFSDENDFTSDGFDTLCTSLRTRRIQWTYPGLATVPSSYFAEEAAFLARRYAENHFHYTLTTPKELPEYLIP